MWWKKPFLLVCLGGFWGSSEPEWRLSFHTKSKTSYKACLERRTYFIAEHKLIKENNEIRWKMKERTFGF